MDLLMIGRLLSSDSRVKILSALMSGEALPASELAYRAGVSNQTASEHLKSLETAEIIKSRRCGRHRYYEISGAAVAQALEQLSVTFHSVQVKAPSSVPEKLKHARFCYDHLAGKIGVEITNSLTARGALTVAERDYVVATESHPIFVNLGIDFTTVRKKKRRFANQCIDWSERRPHVAGSLGAALAGRFLELEWIVRNRDDRSAAVSDLGRKGFYEVFGIET